MGTKTAKQRKSFKKLEKRFGRIHKLKDIGEIVAPKEYSFRDKGKEIVLLYEGNEIRRFRKGETKVSQIREVILNHKKDNLIYPESLIPNKKKIYKRNKIGWF